MQTSGVKYWRVQVYLQSPAYRSSFFFLWYHVYSWSVETKADPSSNLIRYKVLPRRGFFESLQSASTLGPRYISDQRSTCEIRVMYGAFSSFSALEKDEKHRRWCLFYTQIIPKFISGPQCHPVPYSQIPKQISQYLNRRKYNLDRCNSFRIGLLQSRISSLLTITPYSLLLTNWAPCLLPCCHTLRNLLSSSSLSQPRPSRAGAVWEGVRPAVFPLALDPPPARKVEGPADGSCSLGTGVENVRNETMVVTTVMESAEWVSWRAWGVHGVVGHAGVST